MHAVRSLSENRRLAASAQETIFMTESLLAPFVFIRLGLVIYMQSAMMHSEQILNRIAVRQS